MSREGDMTQERLVFKLHRPMSDRELKTALGDGRGRIVQLEDRSNIPIEYEAPALLIVNYVYLGFFNGEQIVITNPEGLDRSMAIKDTLLSKILEIASAV